MIAFKSSADRADVHLERINLPKMRQRKLITKDGEMRSS
jgi:hypothetical protein